MARVEDLGKALVTVALVLAVVGLALWFGSRIGLGRLPGDLDFRVGNARVAVPIVTCILLSVVLTIVLNLFARR